jgi:hypothetical protein
MQSLGVTRVDKQKLKKKIVLNNIRKLPGFDLKQENMNYIMSKGTNVEV